MVLNRADVIPAKKMSECLKLLEERLARSLILLSVQRKELVQERLLPAILKACVVMSLAASLYIPGGRGHPCSR